MKVTKMEIRMIKSRIIALKYEILTEPDMCKVADYIDEIIELSNKIGKLEYKEENSLKNTIKNIFKK